MSVSLNMANQNAINIIFNFVFIQDHLRATTKTKSNHLLLLLSRISLNQLTLALNPHGMGGETPRSKNLRNSERDELELLHLWSEAPN